ncbi:hydroxymethylbilane synthase [Rickettsiales endosymbiont of Stachyamoeba lipophora]|uniref:hydroxymethylbilane synthase n=1 Tax=Rickettsiales endosymbiont of Stachyamoeba lipophora TaxID=2486578 RepID=UPI000F64A4A3|nr:hydroxymethylbilane synthase [Rickettsiales endosymbiont of Stachyamoeba lipophora]AZL15431.1 hydroxymethylbilane synthase [Rickettsiales endosymbiont of Stachyamoeba lipophora]
MFEFKHLKIGSRQSNLALKQSAIVKQEIINKLGYPANLIEIVPMMTKGDKILDRNLSEIGGKGLFTEEIELGLVAGTLDLAVHSMKDMPATTSGNLAILATLEREDPRDVLIGAKTFEELPEHSIFGTSSIRRARIVNSIRSDLEIIPFRGNIESRLSKLQQGVARATILAAAGLHRLQKAIEYTLLDKNIFVPAIGQGALAIECNIHNSLAVQICKAINHQETYQAVEIERAFLYEIDGSCKTPIGGLCELQDGIIKGIFMAATAQEILKEEIEVPLEEAYLEAIRIAKKFKNFL